MFEAPQTKEKSSKAGMLVGVGVVVILAVAAFFYVNSKNSPETQPRSGAATAAAAAAGKPDAVHDLRIVNVKMDKDTTGNVAVWSVDIRNLSAAYTYSSIAYQTTYIGADNSVLLQNQGKVNLSLEPGEEQTTQFRDALYPSGTAVFKFAVTDAAAKR